MLPIVTLQIRSGELGYRYLVREVDWCEVWTPDHMLVAEFPGHVLLAMLLRELAQADLTAKLHDALAAGEQSRLPLFAQAAYRGLEPVPDRTEPFKVRALREARPVTPAEKESLRVARRNRRR